MLRDNRLTDISFILGITVPYSSWQLELLHNHVHSSVVSMRLGEGSALTTVSEGPCGCVVLRVQACMHTLTTLPAPSESEHWQ